MKKRNIPFSPPSITESEINEVCDALRSGWITTGPRTKELEKRIAEYCGTDKAVCLNSATASLELNLRVLGIGAGDEVIVPAYTYTATASPVAHVGATIVMADCKKGCPQIDMEKLADLITEKTKAIILVDIAGVIEDYESAFRIAEEKKALFTPSNDIQKALGRVAVLADCAHSLGAVQNGNKAGSIADFSSFSFHAVKNLTTAEGGAATWRTIEGVDNDELYSQYQLFSLHGQSKDALAKTKLGSWEYDVVGAWYKCNMTDIAAAMGLSQLNRYENILARRHEIIEKYNACCDRLGVDYIRHSAENHKSSGHLYLVNIPGISTTQRDEIIEKMADEGIACNVHYKPLPMMTAYRNMGFDISVYPCAYDYFSREISLPLHNNLSDEDIEYVICCFEEIVRKYIKED